MELALYSILTIDVRGLAKNKLYICKEYNYSPEYIDKMPFYEYEWLIQDINELRKKEDEERKKQEKGNSPYKPPKMPGMPKMPSMPKMPIISVPKF